MRAILEVAGNSVDIRKIEIRRNTLGIEIERQRDEVDVAGALAVAEQAAFNAVGTVAATAVPRSLCG